MSLAVDKSDESNAGVETMAQHEPERRLSLKAKGSIFIALLAIYATFLTVYVLNQQGALLKRFVTLQDSFSEHSQIRQGNRLALSLIQNILIDIESVESQNLGNDNAVYGFEHIKLELSELRQKIKGKSPTIIAMFSSLNSAFTGSEKPDLISSKKALEDMRSELAFISNERQRSLDALITGYRAAGESLTTRVLAFGLVGIAFAAMIVILFFSKLTRDLNLLRSHAGKIASGGGLLQGDIGASKRNDEVGKLSEAIDKIASQLKQREQELDIERKKSFHKEKMAAIGTLAAGIAHEVGNPIAAISALVHETRKEQLSELMPCRNEQCRGNLDFILHHAERLATVTREVSEFSAPQPSLRQLLDLNTLIRSAGSLMKYDSRFRRVDLQLNLDGQLPAITGMADQLLQVIMNLLINAADALVDVEDRTPTVTCSTNIENGNVLLSVADNGKGMDGATREHAFEAFYTTKPAGKGTGLGLSLCHSVVEDHHGTVEIYSTPGKGARVLITLPVNETEQLEQMEKT